MDTIFEFCGAIILVSIAIIALTFATVIAYATFVGIVTYFEERRKKKKDE